MIHHPARVLLTAAAALLMGLPGHAAALEGLTPIPKIASVAPGDAVAICTGSEAGQYFKTALQMVGVVEHYAGVQAMARPGGGTVGCLNALAEGRMQAAIIQLDGQVWLHQTDSPLFAQLATAGPVLTETALAICRRDVDESNFNNVAQNRDYQIAMAGGVESGSNLFVNVINSYDGEFGDPDWSYTGGWREALSTVQSGFAHCAFGVMDVDNPAWETLDDEFGGDLRLLEFWDNDIDDHSFPGGQVYGRVRIAEEHPLVDDLLDWRGRRGEGTWSPEVPAVPALLVYRRDAVDDATAAALTRAAEYVARLKPIEY